MKEGISIIIPAHNEGERIGKTLESYAAFFRKKKKNKEIRDFEIVIVLNACKDNTLEVVEKARKKYKEITYLDFERGGKGFAIIEGFKYSLKKENELIGFVDADMATSPEAFYELAENIKKVDGVIASRGMKNSVVKTSFIRKLTNKGFNFVVRVFLFLPYSDTQCGAKLFRKEALKNVINELGITQWAFDVDLLYKLRKKGFKVIEVPTIWEDIAGSKIRLMTPIPMFLAIIRLRLLNSQFKNFVKFYDKIPEWIKIHHRFK